MLNTSSFDMINSSAGGGLKGLLLTLGFIDSSSVKRFSFSPIIAQKNGMAILTPKYDVSSQHVMFHQSNGVIDF